MVATAEDDSDQCWTSAAQSRSSEQFAGTQLLELSQAKTGYRARK